MSPRGIKNPNPTWDSRVYIPCSFHIQIIVLLTWICYCHANSKSNPCAPLPVFLVRLTHKSTSWLGTNCNSISRDWWNVQSAEVLWDALARRTCPWCLCQLLKSDSNQLAGYRSGDVMKNKRENKAIKGKSEMITICFRNIIPVKKLIFILFSLAVSLHWGGAWTQRWWSISPWFSLLNRDVLIWLKLLLRRSLLQGTYFRKPKGEEGCPHNCGVHLPKV